MDGNKVSTNQPADLATLREALHCLGDYSCDLGFYRDPDYLMVSAALDELAAARERLAQMEDVLRTILAHADKASLILWGHPETCAKYYDAPDSCNCGLDAVNAIQESARALLAERGGSEVTE